MIAHSCNEKNEEIYIVDILRELFFIQTEVYKNLKFPPRFLWAADEISIMPGYTLLEIGYGHGIFPDILAPKIKDGKLIISDRSESMIRKAALRNKTYIDQRMVECIHSDCKQLRIPYSSLDAVIAFNVSFFLKGGSEEMKLIRNWLNPEGILYVFYQQPSDRFPSPLPLMESDFLRNGYTIIRTMQQKMSPASAYGIIARP